MQNTATFCTSKQLPQSQNTIEMTVPIGLLDNTAGSAKNAVKTKFDVDSSDENSIPKKKTKHEDNEPLERTAQLICSIASSETHSQKEKIYKIRYLNRDYNTKFGKTLFHEALERNKQIFSKILHLCCTHNLQELLSEPQDDYDHENLLHYACTQNLPQFIKPLIAAGCSITDTNYNHQTPLHIAIEENSLDCIREFRQIIRTRPNKQSRKLARLVEKHNRIGHTVLHEAILHDQRELVEDILIFCKDARIDPCAIEVLGGGNTIMHLAMTNNLMDMAKLIIELVPNAGCYKNYAGQTVFDMYCRPTINRLQYM